MIPRSQVVGINLAWPPQFLLQHPYIFFLRYVEYSNTTIMIKRSAVKVRDLESSDTDCQTR